MVSDSEDEGEPQSKAKRTIGSDEENIIGTETPKESEPGESEPPPAQEEYDSDEGIRNE